MNVLLLGATGFSGQKVLEVLLSTKHNITIITRNKTQVNIHSKNLTILEGDVLNSDFIKAVLKNQDAAINCLGIGGKGHAKPSSLVSDATRILVTAMEQTGTKRLICMSNVGAGDSYNFQPWFFKKILLPYFLKWLKFIIDDKNIMEPLVMNSNLDWTILRFPNIVRKPQKRTISTSFDGKGLKLSITNADAAQFIVKQLSDYSLIHKAPCVSN
ncbi:MAG: NAD(P)H-binding protein [Flavobacteriales bacterium]|nr:NAD(P)H-binding protein [Flavobacteriales bacterium]